MEEVIKRIRQGKRVIKRTESVKLHIESPYPFVLITINQDINIQKLLWGFPSYIIFERFEKKEREFLKSILSVLKEKFKSVLVINIEENKKQKAVFGIYPYRYGELTEIVETLKYSLEEISIHREHLRVKVYKTSKRKFKKEKGIHFLSIGIKPIYKKENLIFPYEFRKLHHGLSVAIKKAFYRFSEKYTEYKPVHYFEIGKKVFNRLSWDVDKKLTQIGDTFDFLLLLTPVNIEECWKEFKHSGFTRKPEFHYRPVDFEVSHIKKRLFSIPVEHVEDPVLYELFSKKRDELDIQLSMIEFRGTEKCLWGSVQLYGKIDEDLVKDAEFILSVEEKKEKEEKSISAKELAEMAKEEIDYYRGIYPHINSKVKVREDIVSKAIVSDGNLYIYRYATFSKREVKALLNHEVGTHILTYVNGLTQRFRLLHVGLDGYEEMQEGLAVLSELLTDSLSIKRLKVLAARVIGSDMIVKGADFIEVFRKLKSYDFSDREAFMITSRVFRGGGLIKDSIYLRGFLKVLSFIQTKNDVETLYCGKFSFSHYPIIRELMYRGLVKKPVLIPRYLQKSEEKLKRIKKGLNLSDILKESLL